MLRASASNCNRTSLSDRIAANSGGIRCITLIGSCRQRGAHAVFGVNTLTAPRHCLEKCLIVLVTSVLFAFFLLVRLNSFVYISRRLQISLQCTKELQNAVA